MLQQPEQGLDVPELQAGQPGASPGRPAEEGKARGLAEAGSEVPDTLWLPVCQGVKIGRDGAAGA
ncbi:MAG: hypothetical protein J5863_04020, partial [Desulfovibrio sp.]|nr:hypothetical protein [Desulfovibrio sp.]